MIKKECIQAEVKNVCRELNVEIQEVMVIRNHPTALGVYNYEYNTIRLSKRNIDKWQSLRYIYKTTDRWFEAMFHETIHAIALNSEWKTESGNDKNYRVHECVATICTCIALNLLNLDSSDSKDYFNRMNDFETDVTVAREITWKAIECLLKLHVIEESQKDEYAYKISANFWLQLNVFPEVCFRSRAPIKPIEIDVLALEYSSRIDAARESFEEWNDNWRQALVYFLEDKEFNLLNAYYHKIAIQCMSYAHEICMNCRKEKI
jgi:hypothetical protein